MSNETIDRAALAEWCKENTSSHANHDATVLVDLAQFGFTMEWTEDRYGKKITISLGDRSDWFRVKTWEDDFQDLLDGRFPVLVLKPDAEEDIEYFYVKSKKKVTTFDQDGQPKVGKGSRIYGIVKADTPPANWPGSWIPDTPEHRASLTFDALELLNALASIIVGRENVPRYRGRGFSYQGYLEAIRGNQ